MTLLEDKIGYIDTDGTLKMQFHKGQWRAWESKARFIVVIAGTQGGKTTFGPYWMYREIQNEGPGDYMVVSPTLTLMNLKAMPAFKMLFETILGLGKVKKENNRDIFTFSEEGSIRMFGSYDPMRPTRVLFGFATNPDTLESASLLGVWADEAGQDSFRAGSWEAIRRRLSIRRGRVLVTTTPYNLGWIKQELYDRWERGDPAIEVVRFDSTENPSFPKEEYEERMASMPLWRFNMMYRGLFERPAGLIYDCWVPSLHVLPEKFIDKIDPTWPRYVGLDFGLMNFTAGIFARDPKTKRFYMYREYPDEIERRVKHAEFSMRQHVQRILAEIPQYEEGGWPRIRAIGGAFSEDIWRNEVTQAGLRVERPDQRDVEVGITRVYSTIRRNELFILDNCKATLDQLGTYSRVLDPDTNEPTEEIKDKSDYHYLDLIRYVVGTSVKDRESVPAHSIRRRVTFA